jgi:hypothetical protein
MKKIIAVYDSYDQWVHDIERARLNSPARKSFRLVTLRRGSIIPDGAYVFARLNMNPLDLSYEKGWLEKYYDRPDLKWITSPTQLSLYEDKMKQALLFRSKGILTPLTVAATDRDVALNAVDDLAISADKIVLKARFGASSQFVRVVDPGEAKAYLNQIFGDGVPLASNKWKLWKNHAVVQEFLPGNSWTWRVNVVGDQQAYFRRYNYADRPVAQTGNVEAFNDVPVELTEFADQCSHLLNSRWCALDILTDPRGEYRLIETSLGWPFPGEGGTALWHPSGAPWNEMFYQMFEEIEDGTFD